VDSSFADVIKPAFGLSVKKKQGKIKAKVKRGKAKAGRPSVFSTLLPFSPLLS
jgi:hypothetical protein